MKKLFVGLVALTLLAGCSTGRTETHIENPETLFTVGGKAYTVDDAYQALIKSDPGTLLINRLEAEQIEILKKETPLDTSEAVTKQLESIKSELGTDYDAYMTKQYGTEAYFIENVLEPQVYLQMYYTIKLRDSDLEQAKKDYEVKMLRVYLFNDKTDAESVSKLLKELGDVEKMEAQISPAGDTNLLYAKNHVGLAADMIAVADKLKKVNDSEIYEDTTNSQYYVFVYATDTVDTDSTITMLLNQTNYIDSRIGALLIERGFEVFDANVKDQLKTEYGPYLKP